MHFLLVHLCTVKMGRQYWFQCLCLKVYLVDTVTGRSYKEFSLMSFIQMVDRQLQGYVDNGNQSRRPVVQTQYRRIGKQQQLAFSIFCQIYDTLIAQLVSGIMACLAGLCVYHQQTFVLIANPEPVVAVYINPAYLLLMDVFVQLIQFSDVHLLKVNLHHAMGNAV